MNVRKELFSLQDVSYRDFQSSLIPGISKKSFIGVRLPEVRKIAKRMLKEAQTSIFLRDLPHIYHDENMLHAILISEIKDYEGCIKAVDNFLPYVNNWAVCDSISPKVFKKNKDLLLKKIKKWSLSEDTYTRRFGIKMLMTHFLDEDFKVEYLELSSKVSLEDYYVKMMVAWFFATALAKQWDATVSYIENARLDIWVHNKTIQKACESNRITLEKKKYLKTLKR